VVRAASSSRLIEGIAAGAQVKEYSDEEPPECLVVFPPGVGVFFGRVRESTLWESVVTPSTTPRPTRSDDSQELESVCLTREQLDNIVRVFQKYDKGTAAIAKTDLVPLCRVRVSGGSASFSLLECDTCVK